jgi:3-deoxy-D-manno-octulosonic-acid transferase
MANPNIVNVTSILGKTTYITPANTSANVLLSNAASSGEVLKINQIVAANVDGTSAVDCTVTINTAAAGGGTAYPIVSTVSVPADASLIVADKTTAIYLEEDKSIVVTSGSANDLAFTISYEIISSS